MSLLRCSPPQKRDALDEVSTSRYLKIVIPPFVYPSKILCPQLLCVQYVVAVVNVVVPRLDKRRVRDGVRGLFAVRLPTAMVHKVMSHVGMWKAV